MKHKIQVVMLPTEDKLIEGMVLLRHLWKDDPKLECRSLWQYKDTIIIDEVEQYTTLNGSFRDAISSFIPQHLYITIDQSIEPIKESDWYLEAIMGSYMIHQMNAKSLEGWNSTEDKLDNFKRRCRKVIATTDPKLMYLSNNGRVGYAYTQVQQSFIKKYVANPDREWEVEYNTMWKNEGKNGLQPFPDLTTKDRRYVLKLSQDNTVIFIKKPTPYEQSLIDSADMELVAEMIVFNAKSTGEKMYSREEVEKLLTAIALDANHDLEKDFTFEKIEDWIKENL